MERILRNICLIILLLSMLLLLGSGRNSQLPVERSEAECAAEEIGQIVPKGDRREWKNAAAKRPLWLLRVTSSAVSR
ncbi:MAG: hypothetical protein IJV93_02485 [Lentisphaeria bacterium]|nr:hypothetical protein [Lentisphaeria bacterium]